MKCVQGRTLGEIKDFAPPIHSGLFILGLVGCYKKMYLDVKTGKNKKYEMFRGFTLFCKKKLGHFGAHLVRIFREWANLKNRKSQNVTRFSFLAKSPVWDLIET